MKSVRLFYTKTGRMKFVSHLDMNRFMSRLIARTSLPVWFTEGFNQHIYTNFAVPLSLGYEGLYEVMDIRLTDDNYPLETVTSKLNAVSVPDIRFWASAPAVLAMKDIAFAEYLIKLDTEDKQILEKITEFFKNDSIICEKRTKKGTTKQIDLISNIKKAELCENTLDVILSAGNEDNLNPSLVMNAFFEKCGVEPLFYSVTRTAIYDKNLDKFV